MILATALWLMGILVWLEIGIRGFLLTDQERSRYAPLLPALFIIIYRPWRRKQERLEKIKRRLIGQPECACYTKTIYITQDRRRYAIGRFKITPAIQASRLDQLYDAAFPESRPRDPKK